MAGDVIGTTKCDCGDGGTVQWTKSKGGSVSGKCLGDGNTGCGEQRFKRTPNAVARIMRQLGLSGGDAPAGDKKPAAGSDDFLDKFK